MTCVGIVGVGENNMGWNQRNMGHDEQELKSGGIVFDRLFISAQREGSFRVIERVTHGRG